MTRNQRIESIEKALKTFNSYVFSFTGVDNVFSVGYVGNRCHLVSNVDLKSVFLVNTFYLTLKEMDTYLWHHIFMLTFLLDNRVSDK